MDAFELLAQAAERINRSTPQKNRNARVVFALINFAHHFELLDLDAREGKQPR